MYTYFNALIVLPFIKDEDLLTSPKKKEERKLEITEWEETVSMVSRMATKISSAHPF